MALDVHPHLLRALRAVLETGSFTAAAERLGFTQSALSKQIATLEEAAGTRLVLRRPRGVQATEAGRRLAARAGAILDHFDAAERELQTLDRALEGAVTLGGFPATAMRLVPSAIAQLRLIHPSLDVQFAESSTPVQLRRLRAGRIDLGIIASGADLPDWDTTGIDSEELPTGRLRVAVAESHPLADRGRVSVAELDGQTWVTGRGAPGEPQFGAWPTLAAPIIGAQLAEWSARLGFVAAGLGVTTVPTLLLAALPRGVVTVDVDDPRFAGRSMRLARVGALSPAAAALRAAILREATRIAAPAS